jgi:signal transduction histidine kinase
VDNARLFEETIRWAKQLSALYNVTATVNQSLELEGVLEEVIKKITGIFHFDTMRIFIFNPKMDELHLRASFPPDREDISHVRMFRRGEGVVGRVADSGKAMIFEDARTDPEYLALSKTKTTQKGGFSFFAAFPIKAKQRSIGAIMCNSKVSLRLTLDEVQLIESMADQIGVAVENANLFYEARRKSAELEQANIELVEANRAKADFLAAMSHELRTPLNVIIGNADLIRDGMFGDITEKQKIAMEKILHYSETLLKLINDVLTLTRVEAQKASLKVSTFDVGEIIAHAQSYVEHLNRDGHLKVLWHVERGLPPMTTDALKLEEILQNLIGNAFKFTPKGRIEVRVQDLRGNGRIEFSVADTGIGIANHELDKIFEQFHQLGEAHTGTYSGVGLGLNIVKRYVEVMQGKIRVESAPGRGSTFIFELPYSI